MKHKGFSQMLESILEQKMTKQGFILSRLLKKNESLLFYHMFDICNTWSSHIIKWAQDEFLHDAFQKGCQQAE